MTQDRKNAALSMAGQIHGLTQQLDVEALAELLQEQEKAGEGPEFYLRGLRDMLSFAAAVRANDRENGHQRLPLEVIVIGAEKPN